MYFIFFNHKKFISLKKITLFEFRNLFQFINYLKENNVTTFKMHLESFEIA